jgi:hypothetical protein
MSGLFSRCLTVLSGCVLLHIVKYYKDKYTYTSSTKTASGLLGCPSWNLSLHHTSLLNLSLQLLVRFLFFLPSVVLPSSPPFSCKALAIHSRKLPVSFSSSSVFTLLVGSLLGVHLLCPPAPRLLAGLNITSLLIYWTPLAQPIDTTIHLTL